jgi:CBS domain-containing protein
MQAIDVMHTQLMTVSTRDTVEHAARLMLEHRVSGLTVIEDAGRPVGIVTKGDESVRVENDTRPTSALFSVRRSPPARRIPNLVEIAKVNTKMIRRPLGNDIYANVAGEEW